MPEAFITILHCLGDRRGFFLMYNSEMTSVVVMRLWVGFEGLKHSGNRAQKVLTTYLDRGCKWDTVCRPPSR